MRVYFPNRDAEPSANARRGRFGDSDEADKPIARHQGIVQGVRVRSAAIGCGDGDHVTLWCQRGGPAGVTMDSAASYTP